MSELAPQARGHRLHEDLREPRLRERLAVRLACEIVSGRMASGSAFPSAEDIVQRFGVSRTVARETVHTLSMLGLVLVQHGKRTEVRPSDDWDILSDVVQEAVRRENRVGPLLRDLYEFRLLVEPDAARLMAERATDGEVSELARLAKTMSDLASGAGEEQGASTDAAFHAADWDFHHLVARASGNSLLGAVIRDIREVLATLWSVSRLGPEDVSKVADYHARIATAIASRDPAAAADAMRDHLTWASTLDLTQMNDRRG
jgi:GntR family transcriptional repressor for pyruvate dehydrogenase complex